MAAAATGIMRMGMIVIVVVVVVFRSWNLRSARVQLARSASSAQAPALVRQRQQGIPLGAGETAAALLVHKQCDEEAGEEQAEENGEWND